MEIVDLNKFEPLVESGHIRKVISPCGKFVLFNYTDKTTYDKKWTKITINSRGSVYEIKTGKQFAKAFPKFWNLGELATSKQKNILKITPEDFTVAEKADGSLAIIWHDGEKWRVNTRGSFTSDQAIKATEMLKKYNMVDMPKNCTLLAEIIYPENKIIVDYGDDEKLVILGGYNIEHDFELSEDDLKCLSEDLNMPKAQLYFKTWDEMLEDQKNLPKDNEGYVIRMNKTGERFKIKGERYLAIARVLSHMSPLEIWRNMENGKVKTEFLEDLPEEFREDIDKIVEKLENRYVNIIDELSEDWDLIHKSLGFDPDMLSEKKFKKQYGITVKFLNSKNMLKHSKMAFAYLNNKPEKGIMELIKPKGNKM